MKTWRRPALASVLILAGLLFSTGCSTLDRFRSAESKKNRALAAGKKYMDEKKYAEAKIEYMNAVKIDPKSAEAQYQLGLAAFAVHEYPRAYRAFGAAVAADPKHVDALRQMAIMELTAKRFDQARQHADAVLA